MKRAFLLSAVLLGWACGDDSGGAGGSSGAAGSGGSGGMAGHDAPTIDAPMIDAAIDAAIDAPMCGTGAPDDAMVQDAEITDGGAAVACDPATQTGCSSSMPKCAVTFPDPQGGGVVACEPAGTVASGGSCQRTLDSGGNELAGVDNCIDGYCTAFGAANGRQCSRYCDVYTLANCASNERCFTQAQPNGLCRKLCDPFCPVNSCPQNNSIAMNQVCSWQLLVSETGSAAFCDVIGGTVPAGGACNPNANPPLDCVQGAICLGDNVCHRLCDDAHPCPSGQSCNPATFLTQNFCDASGQGCPPPETCDTASQMCIAIAPGPRNGGWCIASPDAGGLLLRAAIPLHADPRFSP